MAAILTDILLAVVVASCWLAAIGLLRLDASSERVQCVAFVNTVAAPAVAVAVFAADGFSHLSITMLVLCSAIALSGAALANMISHDSGT